MHIGSNLAATQMLDFTHPANLHSCLADPAVARQAAQMVLHVLQAGEIDTRIDAAVSQGDEAGMSSRPVLKAPAVPRPDSAAPSRLETESEKRDMLIYLLVTVQKNLHASNQQTLQSSLQLFRSRSEAQGKAFTKNAQIAQDRQEAANKANRIIGTTTKAITAALVAASVIGAFFTGGLTLLIGVAIGLAAADYVVEKATGTSLTEHIVGPLVKHILAPVAEKLGAAVETALKSLGVNAKTAEIIGKIVGYAVAAAAVVVLALVAKNAACRLIGPFMKHITARVTRLGGRTGQRMATQAAAMRKSTAALIKKQGLKIGLRCDEPAVVGLQAQRAASVLAAVDIGVQGAGDVWVGVNEKQASDAIADLTLTDCDIRLNQEYSKRILHQWTTTNQTLFDMMKKTIDAFRQKQDAWAFIQNCAAQRHA